MRNEKLEIMEDSIKIGDRVNVQFVPNKNWQSKRGFKNGYVAEITNQFTRVLVDGDSTEIDYHRFCSGGCYTHGSQWKITKI